MARRTDVSAAEVSRDIQIASNYVLTVVPYAVVLFFAGMSTSRAVHRRRPCWAVEHGLEPNRR